MKKIFFLFTLCACLSLGLTGCASKPGVSQAYWIKETNIKFEADGKATWMITIVRAKPKTVDRKAGDDEPLAFSAVIKGKLINSRETLTLLARTPEDGIARWTLDSPTEETKLYIEDIYEANDGLLKWSEDDKNFWSSRPALIYTSEQPKK